MLNHMIAVRTGSILRSVNASIFPLFLVEQIELPTPRRILQHFAHNIAVLIPTTLTSIPLIETNIADIGFANGARHAVGVKIEFEDLAAAIWADFAVLVYPIMAQPLFVLLNVLAAEESGLFALFEGPAALAL